MAKADIEEAEEFLLDFNKINKIKGVIPVAVQDIDTSDLISIAFVNKLAMDESLKSGLATFWSTSRNE